MSERAIEYAVFLSFSLSFFSILGGDDGLLILVV
jgi:hypothetical protein